MQRSELPAEFIASSRHSRARTSRNRTPTFSRASAAVRLVGARSASPSSRPSEKTSADLLDIGCANGLLLESLVEWAAPARCITPFGVDQSAGLIALARRRLPRFAANFFVANAWSCCFTSPLRVRLRSQQTAFPPTTSQEFIRQLLDHLRPAGRPPHPRLVRESIPRTPPLDSVALLAEEAFLAPVGTASGGQNRIARFAWTDKEKPHALARSGCVRSADP